MQNAIFISVCACAALMCGLGVVCCYYCTPYMCTPWLGMGRNENDDTICSATNFLASEVGHIVLVFQKYWRALVPSPVPLDLNPIPNPVPNPKVHLGLGMKLKSHRPKKYRLQEQPKLVCLHYFPDQLRQRIGPKQRASAVIYTFCAY